MSQTQSEYVIRYYPFKQQQPFHNDRYKVRYRLISSGTGGGKTYAGVFEDLAYSIENPGSVGVIFEPTYGMIKRILLRQTLEKPCFLGRPIEGNPLVADFNMGEMRLDLWAGNTISRIWFIGLDKPEAAEGQSIDWGHIDEGRLVPKYGEAKQSIIRRLRGSGCGCPVGLWETTTPPPPGTPMHQFYEDPETKHEDSKVYRWSMLDNPHTDDQYKQDILDSHHGGLRDVFVYGRFANVAIGSFSFDSTIHVLDNVDLSLVRNIIFGVDFGWSNPAAVVAVGFDGDGRAYVLSEFYQRRAPVETIIDECRLMAEAYGKGRFICDRSEPRTIQELQKAGIRALPDKSKRDAGIRELGGRFHEVGDGRPRIFVDQRCRNLIGELQTYDENVKENDHAVDALRYALAAWKPGKIEVGTGRGPW